MTQMTANQLAQQNNRDTGGRYAEKQHQEADFTPPVFAVPAEPTRLELLADELDRAEEAQMLARRRQAYIAGQYLIEQAREYVPDLHRISFENTFGGPQVVWVETVDGTRTDMDDLPEAAWDLFRPDSIVDAAYDPYAYDTDIVHDPDGELEPRPVLVPDQETGSVPGLCTVTYVDDFELGYQEAFASKADLDAAMIRNAKGIFKWQEGDTELVDPRDPDSTYDMPTTAEEAAEIISEFDDDRAVYIS